MVSSGSPGDRAARSDAVLAAVPADGPGCSAAAAMQGRVVWANARGLADVASGTPLTTATRFDIASVSKQFTATAVLLLSFDGALALTDPLSKHVAGVRAEARVMDRSAAESSVAVPRSTRSGSTPGHPPHPLRVRCGTGP